MSWPLPQDYNEAVQSPAVCFSDPESRGGTPTLTPLGLPKPISGNFASVYQITCGARVWAVRCFLRDFGDAEQRYKAISEHLHRSNLPSTVGFQYLPEGVRIRGRWYPLLKMEWVAGDPLNSYIERNLHKPEALYSLARQWIEVLSSLRRAQVAHGDLQHGNILVSHGQIKLIDYDGLFVPALNGFTSHEQGHRNYQHPTRSGRDYGPYLDAFPGWLILVSLSALAVDPRIWRALNGGDECLLFRREDFDKPNQSRAFHSVARSPSPEVRALGSYLQSLLVMPLRQIPPVVGSLGNADAARPTSKVGVPEWLEHNRRSQPDALPPPPGDQVTVSRPERAGADWLIDHIARDRPTASVWQGVSFFVDRLALISAMTAALSVAAACLAAGMTPWASVCVLLLVVGLHGAFLVARYRSLPCHALRRIACSELSKSHERVAAIERKMDVIKLEIDRLQEPLLRLKSRYAQLHTQFQDADSAATTRYNTAISENEWLARRSDEQEAEEIRSTETKYQQQATELAQQRNQLASREQNELSQSLQAVREAHIRTHLSDRTIAGASIAGVREMLKARLQSAGIRSAADVAYWNVRRVHGIGDAKARSIVAWAELERHRAEASAPTALAPGVQQQIVDKYQSIRTAVGWKIDAIQPQRVAEQQAVMDRYAATNHEIRAARTRIEADKQRETQSLLAQFEREQQSLKVQYNELWHQVAKARQSKEGTLVQGSRALFQAKVKVSTMEQDVIRYDNLSLAQFLRHLARFRRS